MISEKRRLTYYSHLLRELEMMESIEEDWIGR